MRNGRRNRYPGNGPFRDLPPNQRPGFQYGGGRGFSGTDPTRCARFPWLPRWWWANQEEIDPSTMPAAPTAAPASEKEYLENQLQYLNAEMEQIKKRLTELGGETEDK